jgi:thiol-disulfide isomerase/thioredoxin/uncharacterized membrane protein YphA (DoxX/SURF4 family)
MDVFQLIARFALAGVFATAGAAKLADPAGSRKSMVEFGVPALLASPLAWLLPLAELACAIALMPAAWAVWGASGALTLLALFTAGIGISLARGRRPDCHCFGQLHSSPVGWKTVARNGALGGIAAAIVWQGPGPGVLDWWASLDRFESAALGFVTALATFGLWTLVHLLRQNGRLLLRVEAVEAKLGIDPSAKQPMPLQGLPVNSAAPAFSLSDLDGVVVTLDLLSEPGRPLLLVFSEPGCGACEELLPQVAGWQREHAGSLAIVPISRGEAEVNRAKSERHQLRNVLLQRDRETAEAYLATGTPSAVLITDGRIASPVALGADAIRALVGRAVLPPPVKQGDPAPALQLPDLDGRTVNLTALKGRRTLLLFWNPSCGFCQKMLPDVKTWERNRPQDAPELLVISAGSSEANREQGFRARVLLDPDFGAGQVFTATGTPSAVMLDEEGRVASGVGVGAEAVLALAGANPSGNGRPR